MTRILNKTSIKCRNRSYFQYDSTNDFMTLVILSLIKVTDFSTESLTSTLPMLVTLC
jgi:hypothetical protein